MKPKRSGPDELMNRVPEEDREELLAQFKGSLLLRRSLAEYLLREVEKLETSGEETSMYERPSWPLEQADLIGRRRAYKKIIQILDIGE